MANQNPFDDPLAAFYVLRNERGQFSLWPEFARVPAGWTPVLGPTDRETCDCYLTEHWTVTPS